MKSSIVSDIPWRKPSSLMAPVPLHLSCSNCCAHIALLAAGDVYIGTTCFAYMNRNRYSDVGDMMRLASFCAAAKCMKPGGASKGMPKLNDIPAVLLK